MPKRDRVKYGGLGGEEKGGTFWRAQKWLENMMLTPLVRIRCFGARGEEGKWLKVEGRLERNEHLDPQVAIALQTSLDF